MDTAGIRGEESPTCFLHVPKSGGSSVHAALERALPPGSLAPQRFDRSLFTDFDAFDLLRPEARDLVALEREEVQALGRYRVVSGHFSLTTLLQITDAASIATVLREPRARLLSLYMYWRVPGLQEFFAPFRPNDHAQRVLSRFLSEPIVAPVVDNQVCRMLLPDDPRLPVSGFAAPSDAESLAAGAIERLNALGFVGVLELGDALWEGLARVFGVTLNPAEVNVTGELGNPTPATAGPLFTVDDLNLIEQRNAADVLVYDHALACAGLNAEERRRLADGAFARELVKLGDLVGHSAAAVAEQAAVMSTLREDMERSHAELRVAGDRLHAQERAAQALAEKVRHRDEEMEKLRRWLDAVHASPSWRLTAPLRAAKRVVHLATSNQNVTLSARAQSLVPGWSVGQVWAAAFLLSSIIAVTDAILTNHVILIPLLAVGPLCGLLTGRWTRAATAGAWSVALAVLLGIPDEIWDTLTQFVDVGMVLTVALLSTCVATFIERRQAVQVR